MSSAQHPQPTPHLRGCLTCWRRRKKCDLTWPHCKGCLKGGFACLGYGDHNSCVNAYRKELHIPISLSQPISCAVPVQAAWSETFPGSFTAGLRISKHDWSPDNIDINYGSTPSIMGTGLRSIMAIPVHSANDDHAPEDFDHIWIQNQTQLTHSWRPLSHRSSSTETSLETSLETASNMLSTKDYMAEFIASLCESIPPSVVSHQTSNEARFVHTINEYQLQRTSYWFMTPPSRVRGPMVNRLKSSKVMIWTVYLGVELFKALNQDPNSVATRGHIDWIDKLGRTLTIRSSNNSSLKDVADYLMAQLELVFLSFVTVGSAWGYNTLQKSLPRFLHLVAADANLSVEHPNGNLLVSFPRTFCALQQELKRFILYDTTTALVLGVPPLVEYDYDGECNPISHGFQWVHGVPVTLIEVISQINSWRAGSTATALDDWRTLERRVMSWQAQPLVTEEEPVGNVGRLAVQEGWRHVALIYLYMGMCGVSSNDPRVQASITQIVQLGESVTNLSIGIHMLMHYVIAGLGAQYEQHRSIIREKLLSLKGKRAWLFRGPEFIQVVDHLWHGIGVGGAPVTWDDYVRSRCTILPL
ncbi:unnamed protein product [Rhizoctonia solani]|uniref:Zn(2)-C6 fungal-type domain-containing protein n=1 Tax=Rhizoctonia solani TaxID=456999 RepID=A0A8H3D3C6_9AGAM|nr:unnamed protein product [Rhizoctonia solani]